MGDESDKVLERSPVEVYRLDEYPGKGVKLEGLKI